MVLNGDACYVRVTLECLSGEGRGERLASRALAINLLQRMLADARICKTLVVQLHFSQVYKKASSIHTSQCHASRTALSIRT